MSEDQPATAGAVVLEGTYTAAELEAALADPELLARSLAWAGLTVTRLDAERLRVAATDLTAVVRARVNEQCYELTIDEKTGAEAEALTPVTLALRFERQSADPGEAARWRAVLDPLPAGASARTRRWLPRILLALPEQLGAEQTNRTEPVSNGRWIWIVAFVVLLLALGLAV